MKKLFYLCLSLFAFVQFLSAQSPGGVSANLTTWIRSNSGIATTGGLVDSWTYVNDGTKSFTSVLTDRPTLVSSVINFNPSVRFIPTNFMDGPTGANAPVQALDDDYTVFAVWQSNTVAAFQRVWTQGNNVDFTAERVSLATWNDGHYGDEMAWNPFSHTMTRVYSAGVWNISQLNLLAQATNDLEIVDDRNISTGITILNTDPSGTPDGAALRTLAATVNRLGANYDAGAPLNGDIAEIIIYDRPISGAERARVFSYLAMKYGITIKTNLVSAAGTTVWDATANSTYNNAVFGLATDNTSGLNVTQSNSIETGSGNGTGQAGMGNVVISAATTRPDQSFLIVGNDNGALSEITTDLPATAAGSKRLAREWRAQVTGAAANTFIKFDLNGLTVTGVNPADFRLMIDQDGNGNFTNGTTAYYSPTSYAGGVVTFAATLHNNEVFTLITSAAVGTPLPVTWKSFTATLVNKTKVQLDWEVANNESANVYEIEHSTDGVNFTRAGVVTNQKNVKAYRYEYSSAAGKNYFRIRQVDLDGKIAYSKIVSVKGPDFTSRLLNNPVRSNLELEISVLKATNAVIEVRSVAGARIISTQVSVNAGINKIKLPMDKAAAGNYVLKLQIGDTVVDEKIIKL